ncbi:MAG: SLBB domain-containing protein, partial [Gammaproteobacteria bacterium]
EYILDFGDTLEIQLIGQKDYIQKFALQRDGSINLPDIGKIILSGLSLDNAVSLINAKVQSTYIGTKAYVSLSDIRDINVLVSGNAYNPGVYTLSGNSNLLHAIAVAGGINEYGSYREINLIRNQKVIETLDMYDVLITGLYNSTTSLQSGDTIFVKPVNNIISIDGAVKRPAKYELLKNQNLSNVISYANGVDVQADNSNIFLDRILDGKVKSLPIRNIKQFDNILSKDGDKIFIRKHSFRSVSIEGAVLKPGTYLMAEGESINDLLKKSGGYTSNAYPFGAIYENEKALLINKMAKDILYEEFIDNIITASQKNPMGGFDLTSIVELTENLKNNIPNGRVVIDIENESSNVILSNKDKLIIPETPKHIYIYGEVSYEGALRYEGYKDLDYYISKAGGLKENASNKAIYVLHPNGDTQRAVMKKSLFQSSPDSKLILYPGSVIFVPRAIDNSATNRLAAQAYVSILGNIGIALASLSSINNN